MARLKKRRTQLRGKKWCWVAREHKDGWTLSFALGADAPRALPSLRFKTKADVRQALIAGRLFFIEMRGGEGR